MLVIDAILDFCSFVVAFFAVVMMVRIESWMLAGRSGSICEQLFVKSITRNFLVIVVN